MRTNIDIDDAILQAAMRGTEFKTKKDAVEAGLKLLARQTHYHEVLKWRGKLHWDDQPDPLAAPAHRVMEPNTPMGKQMSPTKRTATRSNQPGRPARSGQGIANGRGR